MRANSNRYFGQFYDNNEANRYSSWCFIIHYHLMKRRTLNKEGAHRKAGEKEKEEGTPNWETYNIQVHTHTHKHVNMPAIQTFRLREK